MKAKKVSFFKRMKDAVINFDEYLNFSEEKLSVAIKYILKIALIFTLIITIALTVKIVQEANNLKTSFQNEAPEFSFQNNELVIEGDTQKIVKGDESGYFGLIVDTQKEALSDIEETSDYQRVIGLLRDKIIIKDVKGIETSLTYEELNKDYDLSSVNKNTIIQFLSENSTKIYAIFAIIVFAYFFIVYLIQFLIDILLLSIVGYLLAKIVGVKFKYKSIFSMSAYAITLSIILYLIYMIINLFTGFTIKYFEIAYNAIAYIYMITAMLTIKSDLIKQQIEVGKIVEEQKKVREEKKEKEENREKDKKQEDKKEKKEKKEENKGEEGEPEGSKA